MKGCIPVLSLYNGTAVLCTLTALGEYRCWGRA